jgi:NTE family protein
MQWLGALVTGGTLVRMPKSLLDNSPLRALLSRNIRFPRIEHGIEKGWLDAVSITAAGYSSAKSTSFFDASDSHAEWSRTRRCGVRSRINLDHLMASIAVPMIFPPVRIGNEYFGDGAMRQATPLSPAVHLGADRILVIGVRNEIADSSGDPQTPAAYPSFAEIAGYTLDTLFMDGLYSDLERLSRINQLIDSVPAEHRGPKLSRMRPIDTMVIVPSEDLRVIAHRHREALPVALRTLLWGVSGRGRGEGRLLSYLMFEQAYTRELIDLGYRDAMRVRDQLREFITGRQVPRLFAPHWVERDLDILHY